MKWHLVRARLLHFNNRLLWGPYGQILNARYPYRAYMTIRYSLLRIRMDGVPMRLVKEIVPKRETYVGRVLKGVKLSNRISKSWQRVG